MSFVEPQQTKGVDASQLESFASAVQTLEEKLAREFQTWHLDQQKSEPTWQPLKLPKIDSCGDQTPDINEALQQIQSQKRPFLVQEESEKYVLVVPWQTYSNQFAATLTIKTKEPAVYVKLAQLALEQTDLNQKIDDLLYENQGYVRQVSEDFEELSFLRQVASSLEVASIDESMESLTLKMFKLLNQSIYAQSITFVPQWNDANIAICNLDLITLGELPCTPSALRTFIEQIPESDVSTPKVANHIPRDTLTLEHHKLRSYILYPLVNKMGTVLGWLIALNRTTEQPVNLADSAWREFNPEFGSSEASLLSAAGAMLATHISNTDLFQRNKRLLTNVVKALVSAIEAKDTYTSGHSERVALYGRCLAQKVGYTKEELERLYLSGILHDVGKIGISDTVLTKASSLTDEEFEEVKRHPRQGWKILKGLEELESIMPGVLFHHERVDGKGYPDGLAGDEIPLDGRLLAVVDAFDAMTSDRPYRKGMAVEKAASILKEGAGTQWDSNLIEAFLDSIDSINSIRERHNQRQSRRQTD